MVTIFCSVFLYAKSINLTQRNEGLYKREYGWVRGENRASLWQENEQGAIIAITRRQFSARSESEWLVLFVIQLGTTVCYIWTSIYNRRLFNFTQGRTISMPEIFAASSSRNGRANNSRHLNFNPVVQCFIDINYLFKMLPCLLLTKLKMSVTTWI